VLRDTLEGFSPMFLNHDFDRLHDLAVALQVGVDHGLFFLLVVVLLVIAAVVARRATSVGQLTADRHSGRSDDRLAGLGVEDEGSKKQAFDELDQRIAFL